MIAPDRTTSTDYRRPHRPLVLSAINRAASAVSRFGVGRADLSAHGLLATARARTGLDDFADPGLPDRLERLCDAIDAEAHLHPLGRWMMREDLLGILANRLRMEEAFRLHPEIAELPLEPPVFVVGLQRTGTTVLHRLLAADPRRRFLPSWEAVNVAPLPHSALRRLVDGHGDRRIEIAMFAERALRFMAPDFFAIHPVEAFAPEEDVLLFNLSLWSTVPEAMMSVPSYSRWLEGQDHHEAYRGYRRTLQYLQWQRPGGPWVLKTPHHMEHLDVLLEIFPDARVLQTLRDPAKVLASFCSMMAHSRGVFSDGVDPHEVGRHWLHKARRMVDCAVAVRRGPHADRFLDVHYAELVADPLGRLERVYDWLGDPLTAEARAAMERWVRENPQHKHGKHRYRLEDFGLDREEVGQTFAAYRERFGIRSE
jgi:hypothetical protein